MLSSDLKRMCLQPQISTSSLAAVGCCCFSARWRRPALLIWPSQRRDSPLPVVVDSKLDNLLIFCMVLRGFFFAKKSKWVDFLVLLGMNPLVDVVANERSGEHSDEKSDHVSVR